MRQSELFGKTFKQAPKDEISPNAQLLVRAGFIDKLTAGVYSFLPLGFSVLKKIENIIREEMNKIGGQEILLPALQPKENWQKSGRWQDFDVLFKLRGKNGRDYVLGPTHEEVLVPLAKKFVFSQQDLPFYLYQIQNKFRDELRAKSGLLRGREFMMKDLYSFHKDEKDLDGYYEKVKKAYFRIYKRCGLEKQTFFTLASGGTFSKYSHEFQTTTEAGEDEIYLCGKCRAGVNKEIFEKEGEKCPICQGKKMEIKKTVEVGNIFKLKDKFSQPFNLAFKDKNNKEKPILMGCYGIGLSRLMGVIVEINNDEKGIIWPEETAPFSFHLISVEGNLKVKKAADKLYFDLQKAGFQILYDDRPNKTPGEKFVDSDLIGIPKRIVVSERTLNKDSVESKKRNSSKSNLIKIKNLLKELK